MPTNRKIKITVLLFIVALFTDVIVCGQIKEVGDEYTNSLTASKSYYDKDVDFDRFFPSTTPVEEYGIMHKKLLNLCESGYALNLTGDTLYLYKDIESFYFASFGVTSNGNIVTNMPKGYYIIDGYVFCIDNVNDIRNRFGLGSRNELGRNDHSGEWTHIKYLKDKILKDEIKNEWDFFPFLRYMVMRPVDTLQINGNSKYYLLTSIVDGSDHVDAGDIRDFIPLRFYNEARKFIGKEVVFIAGMVDFERNSEGLKPGELFPYKDTKVPNCFDLESNIIKDGITKDLVKLQDSKFICKDVVLYGDSFCVVLNGEKTGSFAVEFDRIVYAQDSRDLGTRHECMRLYSFYHTHNYRIKKGDIPYLVADYGYVIESKNVTILDKREKMAQAQRDKEEQQKEAARKKEQEQRKNAYVQQMTSKYGAEYGELIGNKQIAIGMTKEMCKDAWGSPMDTYSTTTSFGQSEVWCYNYKTRVYFRNGKVSQIDN